MSDFQGGGGGGSGGYKRLLIPANQLPNETGYSAEIIKKPNLTIRSGLQPLYLSPEGLPLHTTLQTGAGPTSVLWVLASLRQASPDGPQVQISRREAFELAASFFWRGLLPNQVQAKVRRYAPSYPWLRRLLGLRP